MFSRIITLLLLCLCFTINIIASDIDGSDPYGEALKEILPSDLNGQSISREDCIVAIMKTVGVDIYTADRYASSTYYTPVFLDIAPLSENKNCGYIFIARFYDITIGVDAPDLSGVNNFAPDRDITVKETLAAMLRCLTEPSLVSWDNVMESSVEFGLLKDEELDIYIADDPIEYEQLYTLIYRMFGMNCYRYWPIKRASLAYKKSMQIEENCSMRYIDWYLTVKEFYTDFQQKFSEIDIDWYL